MIVRHGRTAAAAMSLALSAPFALVACFALAGPASAGAIKAGADSKVAPHFDIVESRISIDKDHAVFQTRVRGEAGAEKPKATGKFGGSHVYAYVWPTTLDSADVGFDKGQGIVALAVTHHPDFDDGAKGARNRDRWHPHWVVLAKDPACGGGLKVIDVPKDTHPKLPENWPGAPLLIDSPDYETKISGDTVEVRVPLGKIGALKSASFDAVAAGLRVDADLHAPLLCVADVFKVASGNLSLPGKVSP